MADKELTPLEQHEMEMREEFVSAQSDALASEDAELLEQLRSQAAEADEREKRATELALASAESGLDMARVETDRLNNLGATRFTNESSAEEMADNPQTKGGGVGATSASTATPSAGTRKTSAAADPKLADPVSDNKEVSSVEPNSVLRPE